MSKIAIQTARSLTGLTQYFLIFLTIGGSPNVNLHNILEPVGASVPAMYGRVHGGLGRRNGTRWLKHRRPPYFSAHHCLTGLDKERYSAETTKLGLQELLRWEYPQATYSGFLYEVL